MAQHIPLQWNRIRFDPADTHRDVTRKLERKGISPELLPNTVYVVRLAGTFAIEYSNGPSPTLYIGEGKFRQRLSAHRKWLAKLHEVLARTPLEVKFCFPKDANKTPVHRELEAHLLKVFKSRFGELPLQNKQSETPSKKFTFASRSIGHVIGPGAGKEYSWAIRAIKRNPFKYE